MFKSFRLAMTWVHTWFGLVLGFVLFVVFFFGSLSVFDREIDRWAIPETRFEPQPMPSYDSLLRPIFEAIEPDAAELAEARDRVGGALEPRLPVMSYSAYTTHRDPVLSLYAEFAVANNPRDPRDHVHGHVTIDPQRGQLVPHDRLKIGSEFFYPMHFSLHLSWKYVGYWIVGIAALIMLAALVSGVVVHRKLFREFFTFRPQKNAGRSLLDLHNLTGVVALPFHFMFALTGLIIFAGIYLPVTEVMFQPLASAHERAASTAKGLALEPAGVASTPASVDAMVAEAKRRWAARGMPGEVGYLSVHHPDDANSYVSIYRAGSDRVTLVGQAIHFSGTTGEVLYAEPPLAPVSAINEFLTGLHLQHFEHWLLRWLYVFGGLSGCACIATGLVFFAGKRRRRHAAEGVSGARAVDALAVTAVTGTLIATLSMLVANRLLPPDLPERGAWEERLFWLSWLLAFGHAALRTATGRGAHLSPAWREQCQAIAALALAAPLLNWLTTGDHLARTMARGYWPVAGVDLSLLAVAGTATFAAVRLRRREIVARSPEAGGEAASAETPTPEAAAHG